jgi:hypothetical protein
MVTLAIAAIVASCGGTATSSPSEPAGSAAPASGQAPAANEPPPSASTSQAIDCGLLTPADFATFGVDGAAAPSDNPDGTSHYCVYAGTSGATGGIEFDVFPHDDVAAATDTFQVAIGEGPQGAPPAGSAFDEASLAIDGDVAYLTVRQGRLVFALSVPNDINTEVGLVALANLVVERAGDAAGE